MFQPQNPETIVVVCHNDPLVTYCRELNKMADTESSEWLMDLLKDVQLEVFHAKLRDTLQVTR